MWEQFGKAAVPNGITATPMDQVLLARERAIFNGPIFILVPPVKLPQRLSLEVSAREADARLPGLIAANWREVW